jgi:hypothetical protein
MFEIAQDYPEEGLTTSKIQYIKVPKLQLRGYIFISFQSHI